MFGVLHVLQQAAAAAFDSPLTGSWESASVCVRCLASQQCCTVKHCWLARHVVANWCVAWQHSLPAAAAAALNNTHANNTTPPLAKTGLAVLTSSQPVMLPCKLCVCMLQMWNQALPGAAGMTQPDHCCMQHNRQLLLCPASHCLCLLSTTALLEYVRCIDKSTNITLAARDTAAMQQHVSVLPVAGWNARHWLAALQLLI